MGGNLSHLPVVVTGATGRLGRMLQFAWGQEPPSGVEVIWAARQVPPDAKGRWIRWDLAQGSTDLPKGAILLHLAAVLRGDQASMAQNTGFAQNLVKAAEQSQARAILFASSVAVLGPSLQPLSEDMPPQPLSDYAKAKHAAELVFAQGQPNCPVTCLRIANVLGADALLAAAEGGARLLLDPVPNQSGGPLRSWIGPLTLARTLSGLIAAVARGAALPDILNIACQPPVAMGDLLDAGGINWDYGPPNHQVNARSVVPTDRLARLIDMPTVTAASLMAEWAAWRESAA